MKQDIFHKGVKVGEQNVDAPVVKTHETSLSPAEFIGLIDEDKWEAIRTHNNNRVKQWVDQIRTMQVVDVQSDIVVDGIAALQIAGVFDANEATTILQGKPL